MQNSTIKDNVGKILFSYLGKDKNNSSTKYIEVSSIDRGGNSLSENIKKFVYFLNEVGYYKDDIIFSMDHFLGEELGADFDDEGNVVLEDIPEPIETSMDEVEYDELFTEDKVKNFLAELNKNNNFLKLVYEKFVNYIVSDN